MKRIFFIAGLFVSGLPLFGQEPADALRYSWYTSSGSARQQAVGGAMVSLGGDISATFVNPAGLGFFKTSDLVISPGFAFIKNKATYFGHQEKDNKSYFSLGTSGVVIGGPDRKNRSSAFAIAVNRTANFGSNLLYRGQTDLSSYSQKYLEEISNNNDKSGNSVASNYPFGTSLAFNTYWIDTVAGGSEGNFSFKTRSPIATGLIQ